MECLRDCRTVERDLEPARLPSPLPLPQSDWGKGVDARGVAPRAAVAMLLALG